MVNVVRYEEGQKQAILALRQDPSSKDHLWEWEFLELSSVMGVDFNPVVLADGERIVGFNGVLPVKVKYNESRIDALWSCDFYVDADYRGTGLGKQIKTELIGRAPVIMSLGVSPMAARVLRKMGWKNCQVPSYRKSSKISDLRSMLVAGLQWMYKFAYCFVGNEKLQITLEDRLPDRRQVDELAERITPSYQKTVVRSFDYLHWKYCRHPLAHYKFVMARNSEGELLALLVIRRSRRVVKLVDYLGPPGAAALKRALVRGACQKCSDASQFSVTTSDEGFSRALKAEGFHPLRSRLDLFVRSSLGDTNPEQGWFIMGGDSDGELLTAAHEAINARHNFQSQEENREQRS